MATVMIALDKCTKENGCLQVLSGSNKLGRVDHALLESGQVGVDLKRVEEAKKHLKLVYCEMDPGDAFFHCNTLTGLIKIILLTDVGHFYVVITLQEIILL